MEHSLFGIPVSVGAMGLTFGGDPDIPNELYWRAGLNPLMNMSGPDESGFNQTKRGLEGHLFFGGSRAEEEEGAALFGSVPLGKARKKPRR